MGEFFYMVKVFVLTVVCVILLQIKIGEFTLEQKALNWAQGSPLIVPIQEVADGGLKVIREVWQKTLGSIKSKYLDRLGNENKPGQRSLGISLERSKEYLEDQAKRAKELAEEKARAGAEKLDDYLQEEE